MKLTKKEQKRKQEISEKYYMIPILKNLNKIIDQPIGFVKPPLLVPN